MTTHHDDLPKAATGCVSDSAHDRNVPEIDLLSPITFRGVTLRSRIAVSPMCQYCAADGFADDWHLVHLGSRAAGGAALVMVEATAVTPEGRITPGDLGLWDDAHIDPLVRIANFIHRMGAVAGIQLAHAGRKASCDLPWNGGARLHGATKEGWTPLAPSPLSFHEGDPVPREMTLDDIRDTQAAFERAARRAVEAGFRIVELHVAHGYLMHSFLSPLSNHRSDSYGGSLENRMRFPLQVVEQVRAALPRELPLFVRISATDWVEGGWDLESSIAFARELKTRGVDLVDCSSGGMVPRAQIPVGRNYQVPFAAAIREAVGIATGAVGLITEAEQADELVTSGSCDIVLLAREMLRNPYWALHAEQLLREESHWPLQYGYAVKRRQH